MRHPERLLPTHEQGHCVRSTNATAARSVSLFSAPSTINSSPLPVSIASQLQSRHNNSRSPVPTGISAARMIYRSRSHIAQTSLLSCGLAVLLRELRTAGHSSTMFAHNPAVCSAAPQLVEFAAHKPLLRHPVQPFVRVRHARQVMLRSFVDP